MMNTFSSTDTNAPDTVATTLDQTPLGQLVLPSRMLGYVERAGLKTVADLARVHPAVLLLQRNLGRRTVTQTRYALERVLGMPWEQAAQGGVRESRPASDTKATRWERLARTLPIRTLQRKIEDMPLALVMANSTPWSVGWMMTPRCSTSSPSTWCPETPARLPACEQ